MRSSKSSGPVGQMSVVGLVLGLDWANGPMDLGILPPHAGSSTCGGHSGIHIACGTGSRVDTACSTKHSTNSSHSGIRTALRCL